MRSNRHAVTALIEPLENRQLMSTYFISTDSDFASMNAKKFVAGDQILLKGGTTFHGKLYLDSSDAGTATNPIVIASYDPATKKRVADNVAASARATISAGSDDGIMAYNTAGLNIRALNIVGSGASSNTKAGINLYNDKSGNIKLSGITINHVDVSGFGQAGIQLGGGNGKSGYSNVRITYANSHDNAKGGIHFYGVFSSTSTSYANSNVYIGYCKVYNNLGVGGLSSPTGNGIFLSDVNGATVERTKAYSNGYRNTASNGPEGIWAWDANAVIFQYNEAHHNKTSGGDGGGIEFDAGVTNSVIRYNYSHDNEGFGIGLYTFSGQRGWANNSVYGNVSAYNGLDGGTGGVEVFLWTGGPSMTNVNIYDNDLYLTSSKKAFVSTVQSNVQVTFSNNEINVGETANATNAGVTA